MLVIKYVEVQPIQMQTNQNVLLQFLGAPGASNRVEATTDFLDWLDLGFSLVDTNGLLRFLDTNAATYPRRFYRVTPPCHIPIPNCETVSLLPVVFFCNSCGQRTLA